MDHPPPPYERHIVSRVGFRVQDQTIDTGHRQAKEGVVAYSTMPLGARYCNSNIPLLLYYFGPDAATMRAPGELEHADVGHTSR